MLVYDRAGKCTAYQRGVSFDVDGNFINLYAEGGRKIGGIHVDDCGRIEIGDSSTDLCTGRRTVDFIDGPPSS